MKVLLINPPFQRLKALGNTCFPLGLGYVAAGAAGNKHDVRIYDAEMPQKGEQLQAIDNVSLLRSHEIYVKALCSEDHHIWREVSGILNSYQPDIVGISVMTPLYGSAKKITSLCKQYSRDCIICWGGVHPTLMAEEVLQIESDVDYLIRGEGDIAFRELLWHLERNTREFNKIEGLSYRHNGSIIHNTRRIIEKLDALPFPGRELILNEIDDNRSFRNMMCSRGCPFNCAYCSSAEFWRKRVGFRSVLSIVSEIEHLHDKYGVTELEFWDDSFTINRRRTIELCEELISRNLKISWWCNTRADCIDDDLLKIMRKAGCNVMHIGVESGSEQTLAYLNRRLSLKDIKNASKLLKKNGISWYAYFMIGFPYETVEDIEKTTTFVKSLSASGIQMSVFNPYPETALYNICKKENLIPEHIDWSRFSHQSPENHFMKYIGLEEFRAIVYDTAKEIDAVNKSFSTHLKRFSSKRRYYMENPSVFFDKLKKKLCGK